MKRIIYLDYQASTPVAPEVLETLQESYRELYGNPSSLHGAGLEARAALERARRQIARYFDVSPRGVHFTSGATEANNLALQGIAAGRKSGHLVTVATEHASVLSPVARLVALGFEATVLPVDRNGAIDLRKLEDSLRPDTFLVSAMMVNNETGVLHPVEKIAEIARRRGVLFHCDATQGLPHRRVRPGVDGIDLMSVSGHKIYGPKGVGVLYVDPERVDRHPMGRLLYGGAQEQGLRAGTENVPAICGLAMAFRLLDASLERDAEEALEKRHAFFEGVRGLPFSATAGEAPGVPAILNGRFAGVLATSLMRDLDHLQFSSGSACSSSAPSHVLTAMGLTAEEVRRSFRIGFGRFASRDDVRGAAEDIAGYVKHVLE